jgi:hypothetical protein
MIEPIPLFVSPSPYEVILVLLVVALLIAGKYFYNNVRAGKKIVEFEEFKSQYGDQISIDDSYGGRDEDE